MNVYRSQRASARLRLLGKWLLVVALFAAPLCAGAGVFVSVRIAPPPLPVYAQPLIPGPGYLWTPGYWRWSGGGYFWVPGNWMLPPFTGALWTPGYWGWGSGYYAFHPGYWGRHVGFYGGINYGFGYTGAGFAGGYWRGGVFNYNRSVTHIGPTTNIRNVYSKTVVNNVTLNNRASFTGGAGGVIARPSAADQLAARDRHIAPTTAQRQHVEAASHDAALRAAVNHGAPTIAATPRSGALRARGAVPATAPGARTAQTGSTRSMVARSAGPARTHSSSSSTALRSSHFAPTRAATRQPARSQRAVHPGSPQMAESAPSRSSVASPPRQTHLSQAPRPPRARATPHRVDPARDHRQ